MRDHIRILGWLYIVLNLLGLVIAGLVFTAFIAGGALMGELGAAVLSSAIGAFIGTMVLVLSAPGLVAGWGLLNRKRWARLLTIVLGFLNIANVPFGTLLGAYTLYVLMSDESRIYFEGHPNRY